MGYIEKYVVNKDNANRIEAGLTYNKVHTLIIEDIDENVVISNISIDRLIIRNTKDTGIWFDRCNIISIKCENSPEVKISAKYCNINDISGKLSYLYLYKSDLNSGTFRVNLLSLKGSCINRAEISITKEILLDTESIIRSSDINLLRKTTSRSNVIIFNRVGSREDNLIIYKNAKLIRTGCFVGSIYDFIRRVYDKLNSNKYYYSVPIDYKCYEEYITIADNIAKELLSDKELLAYKVLKLYLRLYYKFNNPYKK